MSRNPYPTDAKVQMIFVPPIVLEDKRLTLRQLRVLLEIMQWRKSNSNISEVKRKILSDLTDYSIRRISTVTRDLVELGWIKKHGNGGKGIWLKYEILAPEHVSKGTQTSHCIQEDTGNHIGNPKVTNSGTQTGTKSVTPINTVIDTVTTHSNSACELFISNYPIKVQAKEVRQNWARLDKESQVTSNIELILQDIVKRLKTDRGWISGHLPNPLTYLQGERWNDQIRPVLQPGKSSKLDWANLPFHDEELVNFSEKNGFSKARSGESYPEFRARLKLEIEKRINSEE